MSIVARFVSCLGLVLLIGCGTAGTAGQAARPSSPFTDSDTRLFEDGVDLVGNPENLSGRWADDWSSEMRDRVQRSDFVALVTVNTLRTDVDPQQRTTHWLDANVDQLLKGGVSEKDLSLASSDERPGFSSVERERGNILRRPMLVLGKWVEQPGGDVRPHWHMALASQQVVDVVRNLLGAPLRPEQTTPAPVTEAEPQPAQPEQTALPDPAASE